MILWILANYLNYETDKDVKGPIKCYCVFLLQHIAAFWSKI